MVYNLKNIYIFLVLKHISPEILFHGWRVFFAMNFFMAKKIAYFKAKCYICFHKFYVMEKLFIFSIMLNFVVKNNCSQAYSNKLTTNNILWKKTFHHKILTFSHKLIYGKPYICCGVVCLKWWYLFLFVTIYLFILFLFLLARDMIKNKILIYFTYATCHTKVISYFCYIYNIVQLMMWSVCR